jgi:hypothetical protein
MMGNTLKALGTASELVRGSYFYLLFETMAAYTRNLTLVLTAPYLDLFSKSGNAEVGRYDNGTPVGEGARWNKTRNAACSVYDGNKGKPMSLDEAAALATRLGVPVPAAHHST